MCTSIRVILPQKRPDDMKILYLLHGLSDDETVWSRKTSIERYAEAREIAVIMPFAARSFYADMVYGPKYFTYISRELPEIAERMFALGQRRENTYAAGLSMGGYGAFKLALSHPENFCGAASLSGALDIESLLCRTIDNPEKTLIVGDATTLKNTPADLFYLARKLKDSPIKPRLYQACGLSDFLYKDNAMFRAFIRNRGFDYRYEEGPGEHTWLFWDDYITKAMDFLFEEK